jgi:hypothetical protein
MVTILTEEGERAVERAWAAADALWLDADETAAATGFRLEAQGLCKGDLCVPLAPGAAGALVRDGRVDVAGLWRRLGRPVARSADGGAWVLGASARDRAAALRSLEAPDFALPDPSGRLHALSDHRGVKVLLVTWASW